MEMFKLTLFVIYTILWESLIWIGVVYLVYFMSASAWLFLLALMMSGAQFKPRHFGINEKRKQPEDMEEEEFNQYEKSLDKQIELEKLKAQNLQNKSI